MEEVKVKYLEDYMAVQKFIDGDSTFLEGLYNSLDYFLICYLRKNLLSFQVSYLELEDLRQSIYCATLRDIHKYTGGSRFSTWVIGYARNFVFRKRKELINEQVRYRRFISMYSEDFLDPFLLLLRKENIKLIHEKLECLEEITCKIFYLRFFEEMTFRDIASCIGICYGQVLVKYRVGVISLKEMLASYF